jgi:hypothetical protein
LKPYILNVKDTELNKFLLDKAKKRPMNLLHPNLQLRSEKDLRKIKTNQHT